MWGPPRKKHALPRSEQRSRGTGLKEIPASGGPMPHWYIPPATMATYRRKAGGIKTVGRFVVQIIRLVLRRATLDPEPTPQVPSDLIHYKTKPQDKGKSATGRLCRRLRSPWAPQAWCRVDSQYRRDAALGTVPVRRVAGAAGLL
jgi:hypothetical protein